MDFDRLNVVEDRKDEGELGNVGENGSPIQVDVKVDDIKVPRKPVWSYKAENLIESKTGIN